MEGTWAAVQQLLPWCGSCWRWRPWRLWRCGWLWRWSRAVPSSSSASTSMPCSEAPGSSWAEDRRRREGLLDRARGSVAGATAGALALGARAVASQVVTLLPELCGADRDEGRGLVCGSVSRSGGSSGGVVARKVELDRSSSCRVALRRRASPAARSERSVRPRAPRSRSAVSAVFSCGLREGASVGAKRVACKA